MRLQRFLVFVVLLGLGLGGRVLPAGAATPSLLRDINASGVEPFGGGLAGYPLSLGRVALAPIATRSLGTEVWVTDGTDAGTRPLLSTCIRCATKVNLLGALGKVGIFLLDPSIDEGQLWRSDGTPPGTFLLARSSQGGPNRCSLDEPPQRAAVAGSTLFFAGRTEGGCELWKTDGTAAGTERLREITPPEPKNLELWELTAIGNRVFFVAPGSGNNWGLWRSDGTAAGTIRLRLWPRKPEQLVAAGSRLFFVADEKGRELWTSDGTVNGTRVLTGFKPTDPRFLLQQTEGGLYFLANDGTNGREMWTSDGTAGGTRAITRFAAADPFVGPWRVEKLGARLIFPADDGLNGPRLWTTDGRPGSTAPLARCSGNCPILPPDFEMVRVGAKIFFPGASTPGCLPDGPVATDLWVSDGTGAGTRRVHDFCPCCQATRMSALQGKVFFSAGDPAGGYDVWGSDGTEAGTQELVSVGGPSFTAPLLSPVAVNGRALIATGSPDTDIPDLWVTDGTAAGTEAVAFIGRNGRSSFAQDFIPTPQGARFLAFDEEHGFRTWDSRGTAVATMPLGFDLPSCRTALGPVSLCYGGPRGLWRTDGTAAGTFRLTPEGTIQVADLAVVGNRAVFTLTQPGSSGFLWTTDGTLAGTQEIVAVPPSTTVLPAGTAALVGSFVSGAVWLTDGTSAGTRAVPVPDTYEGLAGYGVAQVGSTVFFRANPKGLVEQLWQTDGTTAGTHPLAEETIQQVFDFAAHRGALYFFATARDGAAGPGLWRSDGIEAGTVLVRSFSSLANAWFTSLGDNLFFAAREDQGVELWRTDGTPAGTVQVRDISPGEASSFPSELTVLGGKLYFAAHDEEHGVELWESDGTTDGTRLVQDIAPGAFPSYPTELTAGGDGRLYFGADDAVHGFEPWVFASGGAACVPSDTVLCLRGGRFKIEADWRVPSGLSGRGRAVALTADTGYFWFFDPANVEVILKVLDGVGLNGHHWVFYGALSNVEYSLTVTDTQTGAARRYTNLPGRLGSVADTQAFGPLGASAPGVVTAGPAPELGEAIVTARTTAATGSCAPSATRLCLQDGRFAVEASWKAQVQNGTGKAVPLTGGDTGYFWFFDESNVEVVLKVLDGTSLNGKFWVFYGALSDVEYTITVTDTLTGVVKTYTNPRGRLASVADTEAF